MRNTQPKQIAIIPDGNRRWSAERGVGLEETYLAGAAKMLKMCEWLLDANMGLQELSLFFVSVDNLRYRQQRELDPLFNAGHDFLDKFYAMAAFSSIELRWVGLHKHEFAIDSLLYGGFVARLSELTPNRPSDRKVNVLFGYDVRRDIDAAMLDQDTFEYENLTVNRPIDLIVRSGGYRRLSGFLPLMSQYAEFEFVDKLFPDVTIDDVSGCIQRFRAIKRKFGS